MQVEPSLKPLPQSTECYLSSLKHHVSSTGLASALESDLANLLVSLSQLASLCQSARIPRSSRKLQHTTRSFFGAFLSVESQQKELNYAM